MKLDTAQTEREQVHSGLEELSAVVMEQQEFDLLDLLIVFAKHKRLIIKSALITLTAALILALVLPNHYTAKAVILPPQQNQSAATMLMSQLSGAAGLGSLASMAGKDLGLKNPSDLYIGMLKSRTVADALVRQFDLQRVYREKRISDARKQLDKKSNIIAGKDGLIDISVEDTDPQRAAAMANGYVSELQKLTQHLAVTEAGQRRLFFEQQVEEAKDNLSNAEVALKQTEQQTGMIHLDSQARAIIEAIGRVQAEIAAKEVSLRAMRSFATDDNPQVKITETELAGLKAELAKFEQQQQPDDQGDPVIATKNIPEYGLEYMRRLRDVKYRETVFELLAKQFEMAKLDEAKEGTVVQVVDTAISPDKKSWPRLGLFLAAGALLGVVFGFLSALLVEVRDRWRQDRSKSEKMLALRTYLAIKN